MTNTQLDWEYLIIWEFHVREGMEARFEEIYGPGGDWGRLFDGSPDYRGTQLRRDADRLRRYVTLDFWSSRRAYEQFRGERKAEYESIDRKCEELTEREVEIGSFQTVR
jgi:hypothetical protein